MPIWRISHVRKRETTVRWGVKTIRMPACHGLAYFFLSISLVASIGCAGRLVGKGFYGTKAALHRLKHTYKSHLHINLSACRLECWRKWCNEISTQRILNLSNFRLGWYWGVKASSDFFVAYQMCSYTLEMMTLFISTQGEPFAGVQLGYGYAKCNSHRVLVVVLDSTVQNRVQCCSLARASIKK